MPDVFISHATPDQAAADAVCSRLERAGYSVWIAHRDNTPGTKWGANIIAQIRECRLVLMIYSGHATASEYVLSEIESAKTFRKTILPVRIQEAPLPDELRLYLSRVHWLDAHAGDITVHLDRIEGTARSLLGPPQPPLPPPPEKPDKPDKPEITPIEIQHAEPEAPAAGTNADDATMSDAAGGILGLLSGICILAMIALALADGTISPYIFLILGIVAVLSGIPAVTTLRAILARDRQETTPK